MLQRAQISIAHFFLDTYPSDYFAWKFYYTVFYDNNKKHSSVLSVKPLRFIGNLRSTRNFNVRNVNR